MFLMDGAMGSFLLLHGIPLGSCLEELNEKRPGLIREIHRSYVEAGAKVIVTNSFGANRLRLNSSKKIERLNRQAVRIAREASPKVTVFASIGPLGKEGRKRKQTEMIKVFAEQVKYLEKEGPDGYLVETMTSLTEAEAATLAVREVSDRYLITSMTFPKDLAPRSAPLVPAGHPPRLPGRFPPLLNVELMTLISMTLRKAGVDCIGTNCGLHPEEVFNVLNIFRMYDPGPWFAKPAAGLPTRPIFPEEFAKWGLRIANLGVAYIGGCCGTNPAYIRLLAERLNQ